MIFFGIAGHGFVVGFQVQRTAAQIDNGGGCFAGGFTIRRVRQGRRRRSPLREQSGAALGDFCPSSQARRVCLLAGFAGFGRHVAAGVGLAGGNQGFQR